MTTLHILYPRGGNFPLAGMTGSITPVQGSDDVLFRADDSMARCTDSILPMTEGEGFQMDRHDVLSIDVPDRLEKAVRSNIALALINKWEAQYAGLIRGADHAVREQSETGVVAYAEVPGLGRIPAATLKTMLENQLNVARQGISAQLDAHGRGLIPAYVGCNVTVQITPPLYGDNAPKLTVKDPGEFDATRIEPFTHSGPPYSLGKSRPDYVTEGEDGSGNLQPSERDDQIAQVQATSNMVMLLPAEREDYEAFITLVNENQSLSSLLTQYANPFVDYRDARPLEPAPVARFTHDDDDYDEDDYDEDDYGDDDYDDEGTNWGRLR